MRTPLPSPPRPAPQTPVDPIGIRLVRSPFGGVIMRVGGGEVTSSGLPLAAAVGVDGQQGTEEVVVDSQAPSVSPPRSLTHLHHKHTPRVPFVVRCLQLAIPTGFGTSR